MASLNPVMTVGRQLTEVPMLHEGLGDRAARARALDMLAEVRLQDGESVLGRYPHQLSGGQQQRIVIAMALIAEPALLIMDEPTTGLDVTVEAAVLELVRELRQRHGTSVLFISHNLGTVVRVCDRIGVMYAGELVEEGSIRQVFKNPRHPYARGLLGRLPARRSDATSDRPRSSPSPARWRRLSRGPSAAALPRAALRSTPAAVLRKRFPSCPLPVRSDIGCSV